MANKTVFNVNERHIKYLNALLSQKDLVIIHGDGTIFSSYLTPLVPTRDNEMKPISLPAAQVGSNHHREFNSGYDTNEAVSKASFRAIFNKGDKVESVDQVIKAFYEQVGKELADKTTAKVESQGNIFTIPEDVDSNANQSTSGPKRGRPAVNKQE